MFHIQVAACNNLKTAIIRRGDEGNKQINNIILFMAAEYVMTNPTCGADIDILSNIHRLSGEVAELLIVHIKSPSHTHTLEDW